MDEMYWKSDSNVLNVVYKFKCYYLWKQARGVKALSLKSQYYFTNTHVHLHWLYLINFHVAYVIV